MDASQRAPFHHAPPPSSFNFAQAGVGSAPARARPRPNKVGASGPRESNALRASVFDVAMELGITNNNLVAEWMFNNAVQEEDEEASPSPGLAHHPSATASDDLHSSTSTFSSPRTPLTLSTSTTGPSNSYGNLTTNGKPLAGWNTSKLTSGFDASHIPQDSTPVAFPGFGDIPIPPRPTTPGGTFKRLKKKKSGAAADGDESDGGYLSDGNAVRSRKQSSKDKKEEKARLKEEKREAKEAAKEAKEEEKRRKKGLAGETKEEKEERKRKKSFGALSGKAGKKVPAEDTGYETDSLMASTSRSPFKSKPKKSKSKPSSPARDGDYETDAGYASASSKKSKSRFFKLGSKSSKSDVHGHGKDVVPPMPDPPMLPVLPIASKFASSMGDVLSRTSTQEDSPMFEERSLGGGSDGSGAAMLNMSTSSMTRPPVPPLPPVSSTSDGGSKAPMLSSPPKHEPLSLDLPSTSDGFSSASSFTPPTTTSTFTPSSSTAAPLSTTAIQDRSSLSSAETHTTSSSMSSNSRRRGYQFSPPPSSRGMSMASHTTVPSVSTINSSVASMGPALSHTSSATTLNSTHVLKPPSISLPLMRSASPAPGGPVSPVPPPLAPVVPLQIAKHPKLPSLDTTASTARATSPMPHSPAPGSPFVMVTASESEAARARAMSPLPTGSEPRLRPPRSPMPPHSPSASSPPTTQITSPTMGPAAYTPLSPMSNGGNGRSISPMPMTNGGRISPNPLSRRRISPLNLAQDSLRVGEDGTTLPSPNVLAYYDIPPPSPPPVGPLPSVPPVPPAPLGAASQLRNKVMERQKEVPDLNGLGGVKRGKQSPFPTRPVVSPPPRQIFAGMYGSKKSGEVQEKRVRIISKPLDAFSSSGWEDEEEYNQEYEYSGEQAEGYYEEEGRGSRLAYDEDPRESYGYSEERHEGGYPADVGEEEMQEVLDRFADASVYGSSDDHGSSAGHGGEKAAAARELRSAAGPSSYTPSHSHSDSHVLPPSFSQLAASSSSPTPRVASPPTTKERDSFALSEYYSRDTMYGRDSEFFDDESIYSRVSVLDPDQSEEARERFVKRVQAMMKARGEEPEVIPPVPKIPEGLANTAAYNRF